MIAYIYLMRAGQKHYKVGLTKDLAKRISSIQTSNPNKVELVSSRLVDEVHGIEKDLHKQLVNMAAGGGTEWFELQPKQVVELCISMNQYAHIELNERVIIRDLLDRQLVWKKSVEKKLDIVLNNYQKAVVQTLAPSQSQNNKSREVAAILNAKPTAEQLDNEVYNDAVQVVMDEGKASTSLLQRKLRIGYGRAARIIEELEDNRIIGPADGSRARSILIPDVVTQ